MKSLKHGMSSPGQLTTILIVLLTFVSLLFIPNKMLASNKTVGGIWEKTVDKFEDPWDISSIKVIKFSPRAPETRDHNIELTWRVPKKGAQYVIYAHESGKERGSASTMNREDVSGTMQKSELWLPGALIGKTINVEIEVWDRGISPTVVGTGKGTTGFYTINWLYVNAPQVDYAKRRVLGSELLSQDKKTFPNLREITFAEFLSLAMAGKGRSLEIMTQECPYKEIPSERFILGARDQLIDSETGTECRKEYAQQYQDAQSSGDYRGITFGECDYDGIDAIFRFYSCYKGLQDHESVYVGHLDEFVNRAAEIMKKNRNMVLLAADEDFDPNHGS